MSSRQRGAGRSRATSDVQLQRRLSDAVAREDLALFEAVLRRYDQLGMHEELEAARERKTMVFGGGDDDDDHDEDDENHGAGAGAGSEVAPITKVQSTSALSGFLGGGGTSTSKLGAFLSSAPPAPKTKLGSFMSSVTQSAPALSFSVATVPDTGVGCADGTAPAQGKGGQKARRRSSVMDRMSSGDPELRAISIAKLTGRDRSASRVGEFGLRLACRLLLLLLLLVDVRH